MPTTAPFMSTSGPPLLPGLIAASVWIAGYVVLWPSASVPTLTGRSSAETMPLVTVESSPNGAPTATTSWPMSRLADLPIVALVSPLTSSALMTAVSVRGSVPTISAAASSPFWKDTEMRPPSLGQLHDVVVGQDLAVLAEDDPRAGPADRLALGLAHHVDLDDRRKHLGGDLLDRALRGGAVSGVHDRDRAGGAGAAARGRLVDAPLLPGGGTGYAGTAPQHEGADEHGADDQPAAAAARGRLAVGCGWGNDRSGLVVGHTQHACRVTL